MRWFAACFCLSAEFLLLRGSACAPAGDGMFQTRCLERHFWLSVQSSFLGAAARFCFEDQHGRHFLSDEEAAVCGYSIQVDGAGDLVLRASFLACHAHTETGTEHHLSLWFVNLQAEGEEAAYPFQLHCSMPGEWSGREMVCEDKYMEVSVQEPVLPVPSENLNMAADVSVTFHRAHRAPEEARVLSLTEAAALGCSISLRGSRLTLRSLYFSPLSDFIKEEGVDVEIIRATILYRLPGRFLAVDTMVACALSEATADGSDLLWTVPFILRPLVHGQFRDRGVRFGVDGQTLSEAQAKERGYKIGLRDGRVEVRIPTGAPGGHIKSGVIRGRYGTSMSVDLFFMSQWEDNRWPLTQHRSFRFLKTPLIPQTLVFSNTSSNGLVSTSLGVFAPDVSLQKVTIDGGGDLLTWSQNHQTRGDAELVVSKLFYANGSHFYWVSFQLLHRKIIPEFIGGGFKTYSLTLTFTFNMLSGGNVFHYQATVKPQVEFTAPDWPRLEGKCTESRLLVLLHHGGKSELQWELFLGAHRLDWNLVKMGGLVVEAEEEHLTVGIPFYSPGLNFQELTLWGLVAGVEVSVVDAESLRVQDRLVHKCTFPARELLVCLPEGKMVALVDTTHSVPPTRPNQTTLLDPSCVPMETDSARALFSFSLSSCGTTVTTEGNFLVYENQISYSQDFLPVDDPVIHRDSPYRLTIQCRYPANHSSTLSIQRPSSPSLDPSPTTPVHRTSRDTAYACARVRDKRIEKL